MPRVALGVVLPLVEGGDVRPVPPIGERSAVDAARALAAHDWSSVHHARLRAARRLHPVDTLPPFGAAEWLLACALNDLLQAPRPELTRGGGDRARRVLAAADRLVARAGAPATVGDALARAATFWRVPELGRVDTTVAWWTGRRVFTGAEPPARLLALPALRRVTRSATRVPLERFAGPAERASAFLDSLGLWLSATPLVDFAWAHRSAPPFAWSAPGIQLVGAPLGRTLALRAVCASADVRAAVVALRDAAEALRDDAVRSVARAFADAAEARRNGALSSEAP